MFLAEPDALAVAPALAQVAAHPHAVERDVVCGQVPVRVAEAAAHVILSSAARECLRAHLAGRECLVVVAILERVGGALV